MNILTNLWNNWSTLEKMQEGILLFGISFLSVVIIYLASKEKRISLLACIGFLVSTILNIFGVFLIGILFNIEITELFRLIPILTYIVVLSNLGVLIGFFLYKKQRKNFNILDVRKEYLLDTTKQTVFLLLLGSSIFMFVSIQTEAILVISILSSLVAMWCVYWVSKYILK